MGKNKTFLSVSFNLHFSSLIKMNTLLVLSACLAVAFAAPQKSDTNWQKPRFCRDLDCPIYTVLQSFNGYELRSYVPGRWSSTVTRSVGWDGNNGMFWKLFQYISGANENEETLDMTTPVLTKVEPGSGMFSMTTFTRSFYIEYGRQDSAPAPTADDVFLETLPAINVYVKSFSGYASSDDYERNANELYEMIGDASLIQDDTWFAAGYDSPYQPFNRHNEVWLMATEQPEA